MKCYHHQQLEAVGICKSCNKGLCPECVVDVGEGIACKETCEQAVRDINDLMHRSKGIYQKGSKFNYLSAIVYGLLALFFILYPLYADSFLASFFVPVGVIFLVAMCFLIYNGIKWSSKN